MAAEPAEAEAQDLWDTEGSSRTSWLRSWRRNGRRRTQRRRNG